MKDTDFYQQILGIAGPWKVAEVHLETELKRVTLRVELEAGTKWGNPDTGAVAHLHKWTERQWRHLDTCQFETIIKARVPSVRHAEGRVEEVAVPWAERPQRVAKLFAQAVIVWLQACGNLDKVAAMTRLDWTTVNSIMKAAVGRGLKRREAAPVAYLGMDEKSFRRGHVYAGILNDLDNNRVWDLVEGRKTENACGLLDTLTGAQRSGVQAVESPPI